MRGFVETVAPLTESREAQVPGAVNAVGDPGELAAHVAVEPPVIRIEGGEHGLPLDAFDRHAELHAAGLPVMAHIGDSTITIDEILGLMRPGDIVTHAFTDRVHGIFRDDGRVADVAREARAHGVRFDVGHGAGSFRFRRAEAALEDGFAPDTISSDLHRFNHEGPVFDLATTMSKYLHLGLSLAEVVRMATSEPAVVIGRPGAFGTLAVGAEADVAVLRLDERPVTFTDSWGDTVEGRQQLVPVATIRAGRRVVPAAIARG